MVASESQPMTSPSDSFTDDLLQHAAALRSLARDLVTSPDRADDAVQETYLRVLQSPPQNPHGLLPWLATVLHNVVRNEYRGEQRRARREALVARAEPMANATDGNRHHAETLHRLTSALRDLAEPYRSTLTERYFANLTPTEMARRSNTPLPTVKARLARGLELLRRSLGAGQTGSDRQTGSERQPGSEHSPDWRTGLLAAVGLPPARTAIARPALPAVLLMAPSTKLLFGSVVVAATGVAIWWLLQGHVPSVPLHTSRNEQAAVQTSQQDRTAGEAPQERVLVTAPLASPPAGIDHPYAFTLQCTAVDSDGLRIVDANLVVAPAGTAINHGADKQIEPGVYQYSFRGRQPTMHVRVGLQRNGIGHGLLELVLEAGKPFATSLLVEDAAFGTSCQPRQLFATKSCTDCHTSMPGPPSGFEVRAFAQSGLHPFAEFCELLPQQTESHHQGSGPDLVLRTPPPAQPTTTLPTIRGVVRDEHGAPLAGARVTWGHRKDIAQQSTRSRDDGSFVLHNIGVGEVQLRAGGDRHGIAREVIQVHDQSNAVVDLILQPGERILGTVKLPEGSSPEAWRVHWRAQDRMDVDATRVGKNGSFAFANVQQASGELLLFAPQSRLPVAHLPFVTTGTEVVFDLREPGLPASKLSCAARSANGAIPALDSEQHTVHDDRIASAVATNFSDVFVVHEASGYCTQIPRLGNEFELNGLAAGFYRATLTVPGSTQIDLGRHWLDGSTALDLGTHTQASPGRMQVLQDDDQPLLLELYLRRPGLDVRVMNVENFANVELPPGEWLLLGGTRDDLYARAFRVESGVTSKIDLQQR